MIIATSDRDFSSDTGKWTGTGWTIGSGLDTHVAGATTLTLDNSALSSTPVSGNIYQIKFTTNTTVAGTIIPNIGGVNGIAVGQATGADTQTQVITATGAGAVTLTPDANWTGTIDNVSVKQIAPSSAVQIIRNVPGVAGVEIRAGGDGDTGDNTFIGKNAGQSTLNSGNGGFLNTAIGANALKSNLDASDNTAIGSEALASNSLGAGNTAVGDRALNFNTTGGNNTAIGMTALQLNTIGRGNTANGAQALNNNTTGIFNTAVGNKSLQNNTTGTQNTAIGHQSLLNNTIGINNTANGALALQNNTTGVSNTAIGTAALLQNTTASNNTAVGLNALIFNTTGAQNTANGSTALQSNTTGGHNTASGVSALINNITGSDATAVGYLALQRNTSATSSTAIGVSAAAGTGSYTNQGGVYVGYQSGFNAATGSDFNTFVGYQSGFGDTTGTRNILVGPSALTASFNQITTGSNNISIGNDVSVASSTASNQLDIGNLIYGTGLSGTGLTVSPGNIGIGTTTPNWRLQIAGTRPSLALSDSNAAANLKHWLFSSMGGSLYIGTSTDAFATSTPPAFTILNTGNVGIGSANPSTDKLVVVGDVRVGTSGTNGCIENFAGAAIIGTCSSDVNLKKNIIPVSGILDDFLKLQPVTYNYRADEFPDRHFGSETFKGLIAQDVEQIFPELVSTDGRGFKTVDYGVALQMISIEAIKELNMKVDRLSPGFQAPAMNATPALAPASPKELCIDEVCINKEQLKELLAQSQTTTVQPVPAPVPPTTPESVTASTTEPTVETATTTESIATAEATSTPLLPNTGSRTLFNRTLDIGSSGADVAALQTILMQKGFLFLPPGMAPGYFGELTRDAVMKYQSSVGLQPVGVVGPLTRAKLNR